MRTDNDIWITANFDSSAFFRLRSNNDNPPGKSTILYAVFFDNLYETNLQIPIDMSLDCHLKYYRGFAKLRQYV